MVSLCRAFQSSGGADGVTLRELQLGLCCLDPATPHGSLCAQYRCQYIFQIYNTSASKTLSCDEFRWVLLHVPGYMYILLGEGGDMF